jgi:ribosomal protein L11 methyltransferase
MRSGYRRLRFRVSAAEEELLTAWLWTEGVEGVSSDPDGTSSSIVSATFNAEKKLPVKEDWPAWLPPVEIVDSSVVEEHDWLADWRANAEPIALGAKLLVDPREWDEGPRGSSGGTRAASAIDDRFVLEIPARTAFGVGSHESTRLAYELLEATELAGKRVLDVGCGSGILAMAALRLGARAAVGFDVDPAAALLAGQYARRNGVAPAIFTGTIAALARPRAGSAAFDVVVLNVLPHEIAEELEAVVAQLTPGGELLVSGVLASEEGAVRGAIERFGCSHAATITAGEWVGIRFREPDELAMAPR